MHRLPPVFAEHDRWRTARNAPDRTAVGQRPSTGGAARSHTVPGMPWHGLPGHGSFRGARGAEFYGGALDAKLLGGYGAGLLLLPQRTAGRVDRIITHAFSPPLATSQTLMLREFDPPSKVVIKAQRRGAKTADA